MSENNLSILVLRVGIALVYLWFGVQQLLNPQTWVYYIPEWATNLTGLSASQLVFTNAIAELVLGGFLLLGIFTRLCALILAIHLAIITYEVGWNETGVRDFGLTLATLAIALTPSHPHSIDSKYLAFLKNKFPGFNKAMGGHDKH